MSEIEKLQILTNMEPIIKYNVKKIFNYRKEDYEDLMQEARMILYNNLDKFDESKGTLSTFCQILIKNNLVVLTKKLYKNWDNIRFNQDLIDIFPDEEVQDNINDLYEELANYVKSNKEKFTKRELMFLDLFLLGRTFKQIDEELQINTNNRVQLVYQLKKKLTELLKEIKRS